MKKIYFFLIALIYGAVAYSQTVYSENMGTPTGTTAIATYVTGTAPATFQNGAPIVYTGTADVRATTVSSGYSGASGSGNVFFTNIVGKDFRIDGINTSTISTTDLGLSLGHYKSTSAATTELNIEVSTDGSTWTPLTYTRSGSTGWALVTISGGVIPSSTTLSLRFTQTVTTAQFRIDDIKLFNTAAACTFVYGTPTVLCDNVTYNTDTYTATIPYTGAGNGTYTLTTSAGTLGGDNPTSVAAGNITVSGVPEGTDVTVTLNGNNCVNEQKLVTAPVCKPVNPLPYYDGFTYTVGSSLGANQYWTSGNTGDEIVLVADNLTYTGVTPTGNAVSFAGAGKECVVAFTSTSTGKIFSSFLMKVTDLAAVTDGASTAFAVFTDGTMGNYRGRLFVKKSGTQYQLGLDTASTTTNFTTNMYNVGDVVMVVMGYDFDANTLKVWVNPTVATFTDSVAPTLTFAPSATLAAFGGFLLRQDTDTTTPAIVFDELRIGTMVTDVVLGVENNLAIEGFSIYPNPAQSVIYITTKANLTKEVQIFDLLGKQVVNQNINGNALPLNLNAGIYMVKVTENGRTATQKLVVE